MSFIDFKTATFLIGLLYLIMPTVVWIVMMRERNRPVRLWCLGGLGYGLGLMLVSMRATIPDWMSYALAQLLLISGGLVRIQALRLELHRPLRRASLVACILLLSAVSFHLQVIQQAHVLNLLWMALVGGICFFYLALLAWRISLQDHSLNARWIAGPYCLLSLAILIRFGELAMGHVPADQIQPSLGVISFALLGVISAILGNLGYIGISLDQTINARIEMAAEWTRQSERKRFEEQAQQTKALLLEQIAQLDRQRSLGHMSASLGHELNQPLTVILTSAQIAKRGLQQAPVPTELIDDFLERIIMNTHRASQIIQKIRGFIKPNVLEQRPLEIGKIIHEATELVGMEAQRHKVSITITAPDTPVWVAGDAIQLSQVIINLLRNAIEALQTKELRAIHITLTPERTEIKVSIHDTGPGLTAEALHHAGEAFFSTKPHGLGMGLSISRSIIEQHHGRLLLGNADDGGARFDLYLPILPETEDAAILCTSTEDENPQIPECVLK